MVESARQLRFRLEFHSVLNIGVVRVITMLFLFTHVFRSAS
jgi:hypothetical protein